MKKKFIIVFVWIIILNILINVCYYLIREKGIDIVLPKVSFQIRYFFREKIEKNLDYSNFAEDSIISKNNFSVNLSNIQYNQSSGELKLKFNFYTNDNQTLEKCGSILRIYDDNKIFYHALYGNLSFSDNEKYLLYDINAYDETNYSDLYNQKLYGELDDTNFNKESVINPIIKVSNAGANIDAEGTLYLGENYKIANRLYIDFLDLQYQALDRFIAHRVIEPLGEIKYIINF